MEKRDDINVRACAFRPQEHMTKIVTQTGEDELYLTVKYRVAWFLTYCQEQRIKGYIDDSEVVFIPEINMFYATCTVYMDGEVVGRSTAGSVFGPENPTAIQTACTFAKGRALANAGFGTVNSVLDAGDMGTCDSGVKIVGEMMRSPDNPMFIIPAKQDPEQGPDTVTRTDETMTLEQARKHVVTIGSAEDKGKTLGELWAIKPDLVKFYGSDRFDNKKQKRLREAAQIIVSANTKR